MRERPKWTDIAIVILTAGIVYFTYSTGGQTDKLIDAAKRQAAAADSFSKTTDRIDTKIGDAEKDFQMMADSSKNSIKATQDALQLDERAWVGPKSTDIVSFQAGQPPSIVVAWGNTGKTPAKNVITGWAMKAQPSTVPFTYALTPRPVDVARTTVMPGQNLLLGFSNTNPLQAIEIESIKNGSMVLYIYASIWYDDVFDAHHRTDFCEIMNRDTRAFTPCHDHQYAD